MSDSISFFWRIRHLLLFGCFLFTFSWACWGDSAKALGNTKAGNTSFIYKEFRDYNAFLGYSVLDVWAFAGGSGPRSNRGCVTSTSLCRNGSAKRLDIWTLAGGSGPLRPTYQISPLSPLESPQRFDPTPTSAPTEAAVPTAEPTPAALASPISGPFYSGVHASQISPALVGALLVSLAGIAALVLTRRR